jgi:uncharacterized protein
MRQAMAGRSPAEIDALIKQQSAWRAELARCGADKKCLDKSLWRRVSELVGR